MAIPWPAHLAATAPCSRSPTSSSDAPERNSDRRSNSSTANRQFRNCLFAVEEFDLRSLLRSGASDDEVGDLLQGAVAAKWAGHGIATVDFVRPNRSMSQIGG